MKLPYHLAVLFIISIILSAANTAQSQKLFFANTADGNEPNILNYIAGKASNNIVIWFYEIDKKVLVMNQYDERMNLVNQASLKTPQFDNLQNLFFFRKNRYNEVLLQYTSKHTFFTQLFSLNENDNTINAQQIIEKGDTFFGMKVNYSDDGKYTGIVRASATQNDSVFIDYRVYDEQNEKSRQMSFILPEKHEELGLENSFVDNSGTLYFDALETVMDSVPGQVLTIYGVNVEKDSLLSNRFFRTGRFFSVHIGQDERHHQLYVSGLWATENNSLKSGLHNKKATNKNKQSFFVMHINPDLTSAGMATFFPVTHLIDSSFGTTSYLRNVKMDIYNDSDYIFHITGVTNSSIEYVSGGSGNYFNYSSIPYAGYAGFANHSNYSYSSPLPQNTFYSPVNWQPFASLPRSGASSSTLSIETESGNNFFMTLGVNEKDSISVNALTDSTGGSSQPEFEFVANSVNKIHYIYSRNLKRTRQILFDMIYDRDGKLRSRPLIANEQYHLLLNMGTQISPGEVIFPFTYKSHVSFARLSLE